MNHYGVVKWIGCLPPSKLLDAGTSDVEVQCSEEIMIAGIELVRNDAFSQISWNIRVYSLMYNVLVVIFIFIKVYCFIFRKMKLREV